MENRRALLPPNIAYRDLGITRQEVATGYVNQKRSHQAILYLLRRDGQLRPVLLFIDKSEVSTEVLARRRLLRMNMTRRSVERAIMVPHNTPEMIRASLGEPAIQFILQSVEYYNRKWP